MVGGETGAVVAVEAAIANAIKASGVLVRLERADFEVLLRKADKPLVVHAHGGVFSERHKYLMSYKGFAFFAKPVEPLLMPSGAEVVAAKTIWMPQ